MANNMEYYCNHCKRNTIFYLESDLIWYCDDCEKPKDSYPLVDYDIDLAEELEEFEEEYGESVYCKTCGNFVIAEDILEDGMCPYCGDELDDELEDKGYFYNEEKEIYEKIDE